MNNKKGFLNDVRIYLESCYRHHHEVETLRMRDELNMKNFHFLDIEDGECSLSSGLCKQTTFVSKLFLKNLFKENWKVSGGFALKKDIDARHFIKKSYHKQFMESQNPAPHMNGSLMITNDMKVFGAHWWLERKGTIIDLSADKFGHDKVIVTGIDNDIYMKVDSMSSLESIALDRKESLMWAKNGFSHMSENKQTQFTIGEYKKLLTKYPGIVKLKSTELSY
jgi:hypothetical protein